MRWSGPRMGSRRRPRPRLRRSPRSKIASAVAVRRPVPSRGRSLRAGHRDPEELPLRGVRPASDVDDDVDHRVRHRGQIRAHGGQRDRSFAHCPAVSTRRLRRRSSIARSGTNSRASSSITACCEPVRPSRSRTRSARHLKIDLIHVKAADRFLEKLVGRHRSREASARSSARRSSGSSKRSLATISRTRASSFRARSIQT